MAQLSKVLKVVCWAGSVSLSLICFWHLRTLSKNRTKNGSVPFPPVSLQRQVVCLTVAAGVHVFIRGEPVSSYFSMDCCSVVSY